MLYIFTAIYLVVTLSVTVLLWTALVAAKRSSSDKEKHFSQSL